MEQPCLHCGVNTNKSSRVCDACYEARKNLDLGPYDCPLTLPVDKLAEHFIAQANEATDARSKLKHLSAAIEKYPTADYHEKRYLVHLVNHRYSDAQGDALAMMKLQPTNGKVPSDDSEDIYLLYINFPLVALSSFGSSAGKRWIV